MSAAPAESDLRDTTSGDGITMFYAATYARLVGGLTVACGSRADAEEVVQEAFARLLPRWSAVSAYDP